MNREILFRGKTGMDNPHFVYGDLIHNPDGGVSIAVDAPETGRISRFHRVYSETVGQFTGLTDRTGKKIFEGDIFSVTWGAKDRTPVVKTFVAVFKNGCFYARAFNGNQIVSTIANYANCRKGGDTGVFVEVIGNIHDNPEVLNGGADNGC